MLHIAGTVKLAVYYHEPQRRSSSPHLLLGDGKDTPSGKQHPQIKGMTFDKSSRCYYPSDIGCSKQHRKTPVKGVGGLADLVLFKLKLDDMELCSNASTRQRILKAARKGLLKNRKHLH